VIEWTSFAFNEEFQTIMLKGIELLAIKKNDKLLIDARQGSVIKADDQVWIEQMFVERAYSNGLRSRCCNPKAWWLI